MKAITSERTIRAPLGEVFRTVSDIRNFSEAVPGIVKVEFLSDQKEGVGTRFRETRVSKGREQSVDLEVAELVENDRVRMVSDAGGSVWDTTFSVSPDGESVKLRMQMDVRPHKFMARLVNPLIRGMVAKAVESDMDSVKSYCETADS